MEITLGTKFEKRVGKYFSVCYVADIIECTYKSQATGKVATEIIYMAKSETFGMGQSFEVAKNTILRSLLTK